MRQPIAVSFFSVLCLLLLCTSKTFSIPTHEKVFKTVDSIFAYNHDLEVAKTLLKPLLPPQAKVGKHTARAYILLIEIYRRQSDFHNGFAYLNELEEIEQFKNDKRIQFSIKLQFADLHSLTGRYDYAAKIYTELIESVKSKEESQETYRVLKDLYGSLGVVMHYLGLEKTEYCYLQSIAYGKKENKVAYAALNNIIDYYIENLNYKAAQKYIDTLMLFSAEDGKVINLISSKTKKAHLLCLIGQGREARLLMGEWRKIRQQYQLKPNPADLIYDSYVYFANDQLDSAIISAQSVLNHANKNNEPELAKICISHLVKVYAASGDYPAAVKLYQEYFSRQVTNRKTSQIASVAGELNFDNPIQKNEKDYSTALILVSILLALCLLALFFLARRKNPASTPLATHEMEQSIQTKNQLLTQAGLARQQSLDFLNQLKSDIRNLGHNKAKLPQNINLLINKINNTVEFQSQWKEINMHFSELYPSFLPSLRQKYPNLTDTELRHCMFIKLNLTTEEIAQILNIETSSVSSARYRLKKKIDMESLKKMP